MTIHDAIEKIMYRSLDKHIAENDGGFPAMLVGSNKKRSFIGIFVRNYDPLLEYKFISELIECGAIPKIDQMTNAQSFDFYVKVQRIHTLSDPENWDILLSRLAVEYGEMN